MSKFQTTASTAVLHADVSLMPQSRKIWPSRNSVTHSSRSRRTCNIDEVSLTYDMNILQHIPREVFGNVLLTLNPLREPDPKTVQGRYNYRHPLHNANTVEAQKSLARIQNTRGISYAGAWTSYGRHEDGFSSGLYVAQEHLGAKLPFRFQDSLLSSSEKPELGLADLVLRLLVVTVQVFFIRVVDKVVENYRAKTSRLQPPRVNGLSGTMKQKKVC